MSTIKRIKQRGQSLIVAIIALFILLFVGGIFVALVARNLMNASRSRESVGALQFAEAGIRFCDDRLQYSPEGADWRPEPADMTQVNPADPDYRWLNDGYTRIILGQGRALVRVSMRPDPRFPLGKYIKVESVGRSGFLDPFDPTTFTNSPPPRLRRELFGYKAIGLTDYNRFITNRYKEAKTVAEIGTPDIGVPSWMQLGGMPARTASPLPAYFGIPGYSIYANCDLSLLNNVTLALNPAYNSVYVAGSINVTPEIANDPTKRGARFNDLSANNANADPNTLPFILNSENTNFSTFNGIFRDDYPNPDRFGYPRTISYLNPPLIDTIDPATNTTRYLNLTRNAGRILNGFNTGLIGIGNGLYIQNQGSRDQETETTQGGRSMRSVWLQPGSTPNWKGPFYVPPGVFIEFGLQLVQERDPQSSQLTQNFVMRPGFKVIRDDRNFRPPNDRIWNLPFTFFVYQPANGRPVIKIENEGFREFLKTQLNTTNEKAIDKALPEFNGVIYAEGNIRTRGVIPSKQSIAGANNSQVRFESGSNFDITKLNPPALTVVSGATIYIEGSLIRESPESMIALLAQDYVVVNTTMFAPPTNGTNLGYRSSNGDGLAPFHTEVEPGGFFEFNTMFGDNPTLYTPAAGQNNVSLNLLIRHGVAAAPSGGLTYINMFVNEALAPTTGTTTYQFALGGGIPPETYMISNQQGQSDLFRQEQFQLYTPVNNATYNFFTGPGSTNTFRLALDPNFTAESGAQPYLFDHANIVPMDVRIEAVMYAQNGSFFIIPGYPMNLDPKDTPDQALARAPQGSQQGTMVRPAGTTDFYPFYNQPIDCRITIMGTVAENRTASSSDQAAWMQLWGYIPEAYGSTGKSIVSTTSVLVPNQHLFGVDVGTNGPDMRTADEKTAGITRGLRFLTDPALIAPYTAYNPDTGAPFRVDDFGRMLPPLPRLPVCPGFVLYGEGQ